MSKVYVKTMTRGRNRVVAVCDEEILGETLEGGRVPFKVSEGFYRGTLGEVDEAIANRGPGDLRELACRRDVDLLKPVDLVGDVHVRRRCTQGESVRSASASRFQRVGACHVFQAYPGVRNIPGSPRSIS